jgi:glycosyltransferase involved in cell wall biosynthesis
MPSDSSSSPIRVTQVVRPAEGGIRRHVSLLIAGLDSNRFSIALYAPQDFSLEEFTPHVTHTALDISARTSLPRDLRVIRKLTAMLKGRSDLVHAHGLRAALVGVIAADRALIPAIFTAHNMPPPLRSVERFALTLVSRRSSAIIAVSAAISESLQSYGVEAARIHVIPNGIPLSEYSHKNSVNRNQLGIDNDGAVLAYIGRLSREKGVDTLLDAHERVTVNRPNTQLLLVGAGPDEAALQSRASSLSRVRFLGHRSDVPAILSCSDMVVVPSYTEGQGIVAIEAMASGLPVVATSVGGLTETVVDGETGITVPPHDSRALAEAIILLLDDPLHAASMGAAGKERALAKYSVTRMIVSIQQVYADICKHNGK